jgi:hypothetical protein
VKDPLNKKIFCLVAFFFIFLGKTQKTGNKILFYFAAFGGEILVTHPLSRSRLSQKKGSIFRQTASD